MVSKMFPDWCGCVYCGYSSLKNIKSCSVLCCRGCKTPTTSIIDKDLFRLASRCFAIGHCCDTHTIKQAEACARKRTNNVA